MSPCNWASFPATTNVNMSNFSICNVSNVNGVLYTPTCNWACNVALGDVNMCNYSISNVSNINGSPYVATCNWALYNAVSNVGVGGYSVLFNTKGIREGAGFLNGASTSVEMYTPVSLAATTRTASVAFSKISGGTIDYTGDTLLYAFNISNPARLLAQSTYGTETVAYLSDIGKTIIQAAGTNALTPDNRNTTFVLVSGTTQNFTTAGLGAGDAGLVWYVKSGQGSGGAGNDVTVQHNGASISGITPILHQRTATNNTASQIIYWTGTDLYMY